MLKTINPESPDQLIDLDIEAVKAGRGVEVIYYKELLKHLAILKYTNKEHLILLRGQSSEFFDSQSSDLMQEHGRHLSIKPTAYRGDWAVARETLEQRLRYGHHELCRLVAGDNANPISDALVAQVVLQHYHKEARIDTPWLDLTASLRMAASFLPRSGDPVIYAFAIPRDRVFTKSKDLTNGVVCFDLAVFSPAYILRPHFQDAYGLAKIQNTSLAASHSLSAYEENVSDLLICKFRPSLSHFFGDAASFGIPVGHAIYPAEDHDPINKIFSEIGKSLPV